MPRLAILCTLAVFACESAPAPPASPDILARVGSDVEISRKRVERAAAKLFPDSAQDDVERRALERLIDIEILLFKQTDFP